MLHKQGCRVHLKKTGRLSTQMAISLKLSIMRPTMRPKGMATNSWPICRELGGTMGRIRSNAAMMVKMAICAQQSFHAKSIIHVNDQEEP